ncbi:MAG TPA: YcxB family protein, partial [Casimicrobiaceae bacterium]|nr:YcxB family protein [Casimicrobiaceae bacterium]
MPETLTLSWRPNLEDAWHGIRLAWWGAPRQRIRTVTLFLVLPTILFGWILHSTAGLSIGATIVVAVLAGAAWGVLSAFAFGTWLAHAIVKAQKREGDAQRIVLSEDGVERILANRRITHSWADISRIEETRRMFILFGAAGPVTSIEK